MIEKAIKKAGACRCRRRCRLWGNHVYGVYFCGDSDGVCKWKRPDCFLSVWRPEPGRAEKSIQKEPGYHRQHGSDHVSSGRAVRGSCDMDLCRIRSGASCHDQGGFGRNCAGGSCPGAVFGKEILNPKITQHKTICVKNRFCRQPPLFRTVLRGRILRKYRCIQEGAVPILIFGQPGKADGRVTAAIATTSQGFFAAKRAYEQYLFSIADGWKET